MNSAALVYDSYYVMLADRMVHAFDVAVMRELAPVATGRRDTTKLGRPSCYVPHQGARECGRRRRQLAAA